MADIKSGAVEGESVCPAACHLRLEGLLRKLGGGLVCRMRDLGVVLPCAKFVARSFLVYESWEATDQGWVTHVTPAAS